MLHWTAVKNRQNIYFSSCLLWRQNCTDLSHNTASLGWSLSTLSILCSWGFLARCKRARKCKTCLCQKKFQLFGCFKSRLNGSLQIWGWCGLGVPLEQTSKFAHHFSPAFWYNLLFCLGFQCLYSHNFVKQIWVKFSFFAYIFDQKNKKDYVPCESEER